MNRAYKLFLKKVFDFTVSFLLLLVSLPLFLILSIVIAVSNQGTPFFTQIRTGKNGELFRVLKFKTMNDKRDSNGNLLPDENRLTKIGSLVRSTSMDEIPQLFNVLAGNMSLIGPRPLLPEYLPFYSLQQMRRHDVKPGITGWAQVNGRNAISWEEKFTLDVYYVENVSFLLDLKIFYKTILKILKSEGISAQGHVTMPMFSEYMKSKSKE